ncbi:MAG: terminase small subunit [Sedimenticola sp.]
MRTGRPPIFETAEQMQKAIDSYFEGCDKEKTPVTVSGLAYALNMTTETLRIYGEKEEFSATVKRAKQRVEIALEKHLLTSKSAVGAIFNLKNNFGWKDKQAQEISGPDGGPIQTEAPTRPKLTKEEWLEAHGLGPTAKPIEHQS